LVVGGDGCWHRQARLRLCGKGVDAKLCVIEFVRVYVCMYVCVCVCVCVMHVFLHKLCVCERVHMCVFARVYKHTQVKPSCRFLI
jgi:hypothetical protein